MTITVQPQDSNARLDAYLAKQYPDMSRSFIQKQIKAGAITVNGAAVRPQYRIAEHELISVDVVTQPETVLHPAPQHALAIIAQTDAYLVINKPAGLAMHPAPGMHETTLADVLVGHFPELAAVGEDALRPGIMHRLDKPVSGVVVVARSEPMFRDLKKQFQARTITKEYIALVHGIMQSDGAITTPISRSVSRTGRMATHPHSSVYAIGAREAHTEYVVTRHIQDYTLLRVKIHTGRTHQIRVHLHSVGHPVVGDMLYTNKRVKHKDLGRLFLHAATLSFDDLSGERHTYEATLPQELQDFLTRLQ